MQTIKQTILTVIICMAVVAGVSVVFAWTGAPPSGPPNDNTLAPINISATEQIKSGPLQVNGFRNIGSSIFDGKVGIGTPGPLQKLQVNGEIRKSDPADPTNYYWETWAVIDGSGAGNSRYGIQAKNPSVALAYPLTWTTKGNVGIGTTGPTQGKLVVAGDLAVMSSGSDYNAIGNRNSNEMFIQPHTYTRILRGYAYTSGSQKMVSGDTAILVDNNNIGLALDKGYVGIGTPGPLQKLQVNGEIRKSDPADPTNYYWETWAVIDGSGAGNSRYGIQAKNPSVALAYPLTWTTKGNVGIGTTDPGTNKLQVNGKIQAIGGDICTDQGGGKCLSAAGGGTGYEIKTQTCSSGTCTVYCTSGKEILGGGCSAPVGRLIDTRPEGNNGWYCWGDNSSYIAYAICADMQ